MKKLPNKYWSSVKKVGNCKIIHLSISLEREREREREDSHIDSTMIINVIIYEGRLSDNVRLPSKSNMNVGLSSNTYDMYQLY